MTEADMIKEVAEKTITARKEIQKIIDLYLDCIREELMKGEKVKIKDLGTFTPKTTKEHKARNPKTGEEVIVPEKKTVSFKASPNFIKNILN